MATFIVFYDGQPVLVRGELFQHALKIENRVIYYPDLERRVIDNVVLVNFINGVIPTAMIWMGEKRKDSKKYLETLYQRNTTLAALRDAILKGEQCNKEEVIERLNRLLDPEEEAFEVHSTNVDKYFVPIEIEGTPATAFLDTGARINCVRVLPKQAVRTGTTGIKTLAGNKIESVYQFKVTIKGKTDTIEAIVGPAPSDLLLSPEWAEKFGVNVKIDK